MSGKGGRLSKLEDQQRARLTTRSERLRRASYAAVSPELRAAFIALCDLSEAEYDACYGRLNVWAKPLAVPPHIGAWLDAIGADDELYPYPAPCPPDAPPLLQRSTEG